MRGVRGRTSSGAIKKERYAHLHLFTREGNDCRGRLKNNGKRGGRDTPSQLHKSKVQPMQVTSSPFFMLKERKEDL